MAKADLYKRLVGDVTECRRCPGMMFGRTFLNEYNGNIDADIMFIGEATNVGRDNQLPRSFSDSPSGDNFDRLLAVNGIIRDEHFVTNTVLHTPMRPGGYMRQPSFQELYNCFEYLEAQILIVDPAIVVTLGRVALDHLNSFEEHNLVLRQHTGQSFDWYNRILIPLYHPSPNVVSSWRTMEQQEQDYAEVARVLKEIRNGKYDTANR